MHAHVYSWVGVYVMCAHVLLHKHYILCASVYIQYVCVVCGVGCTQDIVMLSLTDHLKDVDLASVCENKHVHKLNMLEDTK